MATIIHKPLPERQDNEDGREILTEDPTLPNRLINSVSALGVVCFIFVAIYTLSVVVLQQILINRPPRPTGFHGLGIIVFTALVLTGMALAVWLSMTLLHWLSPRLPSSLLFLTSLFFGSLAALFIFFVLWEFLHWLVTPISLPSSIELVDLFFKNINSLIP